MKENMKEELGLIEVRIDAYKKIIEENKEKIRKLIEADVTTYSIFEVELSRYYNDIKAYLGYLNIIEGELRVIKDMAKANGFKEEYEKANDLRNNLYIK